MLGFARKNLRSVKLFLLLIAVTILNISCAATLERGLHSGLMKGSIVEVSGPDVYICVGTRDGATVGQEFEVYNIDAKPMVYKASPNFKKELTGKIRIVEILDEHFAKAVVIFGKADRNSIVELKNH